METTLTQIGRYLAGQTWQVAAVFGVVGLLCWFLRHRSAHWRYLLWLVVLVKCLVPPMLTVPVAVLPQQSPAVLETVTAPAAVPEPSAPMPAREAVMPDPASHMPLAAHDEVLPLPAKPTLLTALTPQALLAIVWLAGAALYLLIAMSKAWRISRRLRQSRRPADDAIKHDIAALARQLGLRQTPDVWIVERLAQPFVWGLVRGDIYLPADFAAGGSAEQRQGVLLHELAHVARFDALINSLQTLAQGLFFFHPLVWWANSKIRQEREKCCDEVAVARLGTSPKAYGSAIVETLVREYEQAQPAPALAIAGPARNLEDRIKTLMLPNRRFYARPSRVAVATVVLLALIAVPTALVLTVKKEAKASSAASTEAEDSKVQAHLPDGITVELLGISFYPSEGKNRWQPNGSPLGDRPYYKLKQPYYKDSAIAFNREIAFRVTGPSDIHFGAGIVGATQTMGTDVVDRWDNQIKGIYGYAAKMNQGLTQTDFSCQIAYGPWKTQFIYKATGEREVLGGDAGGVIFHKPYERNGRTVIIVSSVFPKLNTQVVAVDEEGKTEATGGSTSSVTGMTSGEYEFNIPLSTIEEFRFQTRPYQHLIFKNVSLEPGKKTDVKIEVENSQGMNAPNSAPSSVSSDGPQVPVYVIRGSRTFHALGCMMLKDVPSDQITEIPSDKQAEQQGLVPCRYCVDLLKRQKDLARSRPSPAATQPAGQGPNHGQPASKTGSSISKTAMDQDAPWVARLPHDVTVELLGISGFPPKDDGWWNAEGGRLSKQPYVQMQAWNDPLPKTNRVFVIRVQGPAGLKFMPVFSDSSESNGSEGMDWQGRWVKGYAAVLNAPGGTTDVTVQVGEEPWQTIAKYHYPWKPILETGKERGGVVFAEPYEDEGRARIVVTDNVGRCDARLIAIDQTGAVHDSGSSRGHTAQNTNRGDFRFFIPLKDIKEFQFQARPYEVVIFRNVSLEPGKKTQVTKEFGRETFSNSAPSSPPATQPAGQKMVGRVYPAAFQAILSNGITMELLGVAEHPSKGRPWWRPDGTSNSKRPYERTEATHKFAEQQGKAFEFVVRVNDPDAVDMRWKAASATSVSQDKVLDPGGHRIEGLFALVAHFHEDTPSLDLACGLAAGPWETLSRLTMKPRTDGISTSTPQGAVTINAPFKVEGKTVLTMAHSVTTPAIRVVAIDVDGRLHREGAMSDTGSDNLHSRTSNFDLPPEQIKEFQFQVRPYTWITFKNVSLEPGKKTDVKIEVQSPHGMDSLRPASSSSPATQPAKSKPTIVDMREWSGVDGDKKQK